MSLIGDPIAGEQELLRFLPTVFSEEGHAIDSGGEICPDMACPNCHLRIPETIIDFDSMFYSIVGAPSSGKSYFLTAMTWNLRRQLPEIFDISLSDSDTVTNQVINEYERLLFLNPTPDKIIALPKTDVAGVGFSNEVRLNDMDIPIALPLPFVFSIKPTDAHHKIETHEEELIQNLVLYDNAGEHFQPGADTVAQPGTKHLIHSDGIIFLFDPACDARMRQKCNQKDPQLKELSDKICNQETILAEMIGRFRRYKGINAKEKHEIPLIISVTKYDMWSNLIREEIENENPWIYDKEEMIYKLDIGKILNVSYQLREVLKDISPEIVATAESFSSQVYYVPTSAFGCLSESDAEKSFLGIRPSNLNPIWITVPMLLFLSKQGYLPYEEPDIAEAEDYLEIENHKMVKDSVIFTIKGEKNRIQLPSNYCGYKLYHDKQDKWFVVPGEKTFFE